MSSSLASPSTSEREDSAGQIAIRRHRSRSTLGRDCTQHRHMIVRHPTHSQRESRLRAPATRACLRCRVALRAGAIWYDAEGMNRAAATTHTPVTQFDAGGNPAGAGYDVACHRTRTVPARWKAKSPGGKGGVFPVRMTSRVVLRARGSERVSNRVAPAPPKSGHVQRSCNTRTANNRRSQRHQRGRCP